MHDWAGAAAHVKTPVTAGISVTNMSRANMVLRKSTACSPFILLLVVSIGCGERNDVGPESEPAAGDSPASHVPNIDQVPLAPRAAPSVPTLFARVPPEQSGIDFEIRGSETEGNGEGKTVDFRSSAGHSTGGICIGDYDADGLPDIFLTRPTGGIRLYRNLGNFRFADVTRSAGIRPADASGTGPTFVDIDNDGDLDLYVCCYDQSNLLFVNQGDGTFAERAWRFGLDFRGASTMMAFMDYDRDGDLDAFLLTGDLDRLKPRGRVLVRYVPSRKRVEVGQSYRESAAALVRPDGSVFVHVAGQYDHLFENRGAQESGDVKFVDVSKQAGIEGDDIGLAAIWFDHDGDHWPDLYVANDFFGADRLYRNNADGTFTNILADAVPHTPWFSMGADAGDLNNDGLIDLIASDMLGTTDYLRKVAVGDFEEEHWFLDYPNPPQYIRNAVYLNSGAGRSMEVAFLAGLASSDWTWSVKILDLDCDGWQDVFIANGMFRDLFNSDLLQQEKRFATPQEGAEFWQSQPLKRDRNLAFRNQGDLQFASVGAEWGLDHLGVSFGAAWGDLDADGDLDLVVNNFEEPVSLFRNQSSDPHRVKLRLVGSISNRWGIGSFVTVETPRGRQMRHLKLASGYQAADEPIVQFGLGEAAVISKLTVRWPSGHLQSFEDLPADRFYTISEPAGEPTRRDSNPPPAPMFARSKAFDGVAHREKPFDDFQQQPLLPQRLSQIGPGMAWGDADGDGDGDLYLAGAAGHVGQLLLRASNGAFHRKEQSVFDEDRPAEDMAPLFFDVDSDGDQDLYVVSGSVETTAADRLYLNDGTGNFVRAPADRIDIPPPTDVGAMVSSRGVVAAADFDRDGDLDLFVGGRCVAGKYPLTPESWLLRNEGGRLARVTSDVSPDLSAAGMVTSALWSDANNDGWLDLLVTYDWGPVRLFENQSGERLVDVTERAGLADRLGWWNGIAGRDLDHDGDVDYVVTNFGLNSRYQASAARPLRIYHGEFDDSGRAHIVEAETIDLGIVPIRGKVGLQTVLPVVGQRAPTFHDFAEATLGELLTTEALERAKVLQANTLETALLVNDGRAHFEFRPLPRLAQASVSFGVVLEDFDADGNPDIYLVQNSYSTEPETGRMAGGVSLLLAGNGHGEFAPVWPNESGLVVPGDGKSLTVTDLNGDHRPDVVVGVNNGQLMAFENRATGGRPLAVRLVGEPGNPTAVGARVTVYDTNHIVHSAEISAGGGYLSQSGGQLFFGLGDSQVDRIEIRWPDGTTSDHNGIESGDIEINYPRAAVSGNSTVEN